MAREQKAYVFIYLRGETVAVPAGIFTHYPDDGIGRFAYGRRYLAPTHCRLILWRCNWELCLGMQPTTAACMGPSVMPPQIIGAAWSLLPS